MTSSFTCFAVIGCPNAPPVIGPFWGSRDFASSVFTNALLATSGCDVTERKRSDVSETFGFCENDVRPDDVSTYLRHSEY